MTSDDLLQQIRDARAEADALAAGEAKPAKMRRAVAILAGHLAELERRAEADRERDLERLTAQAEAIEAANRAAWARHAESMKQAEADREALRQRTIRRAGELSRRLEVAIESAGGMIDASRLAAHPLVTHARKALADAAAGRWKRDDYDLAEAVAEAVAVIEGARLAALGADRAMDALGQDLQIDPEAAEQPEAAKRAAARLAEAGGKPAAKYGRLKLAHKVRQAERKERDAAMGADAWEAQARKRQEAESKAGGYVTLAEVAAAIKTAINPDVAPKSLKVMLAEALNKGKVPSRLREGDKRRTREYDRQGGDPVTWEFCRRYYPGGGMPEADWQAVKEEMTATILRRGKGKN